MTHAKRLQRLWVPGPLPNLNDIIDDCRKTWETKRKDGKAARSSVYDKVKKEWEQAIKVQCLKQGFQRIEEPAHFTFVCYEKDRRRDPDNITAGAKKVVFDSLQRGGYLRNDGWSDVLGISAYWAVRKMQPGVVLYVAPGWLAKEQVFLMEKQRDERARRE